MTAPRGEILMEKKPVTVLYVEDDASIARLVQKRLERQGLHVELAANGAEGLARVEHGDIDVLIVDYSMPVYGGIDVIKVLAGNPANPPVIMLTGNGNETVAVDALKAGASDYLVKDVNMGFLELLPVVVEQVLGKSRMMRERDQMFAMIREREERYRKLVELSPDGIAIIEGETVVFVNPAGLALFGAGSLAEMQEKPFVDHIHPEYQAVFLSQLNLMEESHVQVPWMEQRFIRCTGAEVAVEVAGIPFLHDGRHVAQIIFRDISERKLAKEHLEQMAHYDLLTGLPNRIFFYDRVECMLEHARRYRDQLALLYLDLDSFKPVNDELGHDAGDLLLKEVARRLQASTRKSDSVARIGGDEFVVLLSKIETPDAASLVADKIIAAMAHPFDIEGNRCSIGVSIGIAIFPKDGSDSSLLVKKADAAMYRAKTTGKNRYCMF